MSLIKQVTPEPLPLHPSPFISYFLKTFASLIFRFFLLRLNPLSDQISEKTW